MPPPPFGWLAHDIQCAILEFAAGRSKTRPLATIFYLTPSYTSWKLEGLLLSDNTSYNIINHGLYTQNTPDQ